jgi:hypothetical protein
VIAALAAAVPDAADPGVSINLAACITLLFLLVGPALAAIKRGLGAAHAVQEKLQDKRAQAWSAIDADHIFPVIAGVVAETHPLVDWEDPRTAPWATRVEDEVSDALQRYGLTKRLTALAPTYGDRLGCDRLQDSIIRWLHWQGWVAVIYAPAGAYLAVVTSLKNADLPMATHYAAAFVLTVTITLWIVGAVQEVRARNRVATIFRKYE